MISSLILDWAGTLADDVHVTLEATNTTLMRFGAEPVDLETYRAEFTIPVDGFYAKRCPGVAMADLDRVFFEVYGEIAPALMLFPGVAALLHTAKQRGLRIFLLSTVPNEVIRAALEAHKLADLVDGWYGGAFDKRLVLPRLLADHSLAHDECLYVGDSTHDIEAAKLAGVRSGAALYGYSKPEKLEGAGPDYAFADVAAILKALDREYLMRSTKLVIATVGGLIHDGAGKVLLVRTRKWSNTFGIPGGKIDYGETMLAAYEREMMEEVGLEVEGTRFLMIQDCIESAEFIEKRHFLLINYVSRAKNPAALKKNYELEECGWFTLDEAWRRPLNQPTVLALRAALEGGFLEAAR